jgi:hypothetical protein
MVRTALLGCVLVSMLGRSGCQQGPTTPTPTPTPPRGKPNSTAFENLALVRALEASSGRSTKLVRIGGAARPDGVIRPGASWQYEFADDSVRPIRLYEWEVLPTGEVQFRGEVPDILRLDIVELGPYLAVDTPQAVELGRRYGGQRFLDLYPDALVGMNYRFQGRLPTCQMVFLTLRPDVNCSVPVFIHTQTGELLGRDLFCLERLPP